MAYTKNRRSASDSPKVLQANLEAAFEGPIDPPDCVKVLKASMPFWESIIRTRPAQAWTETDLVVAAHLANIQHDIEVYQAKARKTSFIYEDHNGNPKTHPVFDILTKLRQQEMAMCRQLHVHPTATSGPGDKQGKAAEKAREAQRVAQGVEKTGKRGLISGSVH